MRGYEDEMGGPESIASPSEWGPLGWSGGMSGDPSIAWAAGLFEGEGHVIHHQQVDKRKPNVTSTHRGLTISMSDRDVVERWMEVVGAGHMVKPYEREGQKTLYTVKVYRWEDTMRVVNLLLPHMGKRRASAMRKLLADPPKTPRITDAEGAGIVKLYADGMCVAHIAKRVGRSATGVAKYLRNQGALS